MFRELSDIWPGSEPEGLGGGGGEAVGGREGGVRRCEKSAGTLSDCTGRRCERTFNCLGQREAGNQREGKKKKKKRV